MDEQQARAAIAVLEAQQALERLATVRDLLEQRLSAAVFQLHSSLIAAEDST